MRRDWGGGGGGARCGCPWSVVFDDIVEVVGEVGGYVAHAVVNSGYAGDGAAGGFVESCAVNAVCCG